MATLQKFKLLATQCAAPAAASPSRSPAPTAAPSSPAFRLRRRRTLRTFLARRPPPAPRKPPPPPDAPPALMSRSLADLFVASPPPAAVAGGGAEARGETVAGRGVTLRTLVGLDGGRTGGAPRFASRSLRYRLLRRAWRPVLVAIPE